MTAYRPDDPLSSGQHTLGFGCASLFRLPGRRDRRALLESAYDLGIRHFDVAPLYGLGVAETEFADFVAAHSDIRVATKFGRMPTAVGRLAGKIQSPVRRLLQSSPATKSAVERSGNVPNPGVLGRLLYSRWDSSVESARRSLASSLRALRIECVNYFLLHEPVCHDTDHSDLMEFLDGERLRGVIGDWGPAGDLRRMDAAVPDLSMRATVLQYPYDLISGYCGPQPTKDRPTITYGVMAGAVPRVQAVLDRDSLFRQECSQLLDADLSDVRTVVALLVRDAVTHNRHGTVLLSSTKTRNLEFICTAAQVALRNEVRVARMIRAKWTDSVAVA